MNTIKYFQKVIDAVNKTGVGFKKFYFRSNFEIDWLIAHQSEKKPQVDFEIRDFETDPFHADLFRIKISDGENFLGVLQFTQEKLRSVIGHLNGNVNDNSKPCVVYMYEIERTFDSNINLTIHITLSYNIFKDANNPIGEVLVEIVPKKAEKKWFQELPPSD